MTTPADELAAERAFEALLAGRAVPEEAAGLAAFTGAVRASATQPGRPNAALAELLATGLLTDQSSPSVRTAVAAGPLPSRRARVRRRRFAMIVPALFAKFLAAGAVAQAATGAGLVVIVATGAGATGVLGEDVQDGLTSVIAADDETGDPAVATPTEDPETTDPGAVPATVETTAPVDATVFVAEDWAEGPAAGESFGDWVSRGAHNKDALLAAAALQGDGTLRFGQIVSDMAHKKHVSAEELQELEGIEGLEDIEDADATATPTEAPEVETESADSGSKGKGNGNGGGKAKGNGNSGHGKN